MTQEISNRYVDLEEAVCAVKGDEPSAAELREAGQAMWQRVRAAEPGESNVEQIRGCNDVQQLLPAYSTHKLSPERTLLIEAHLRDCLACRHRAHTPSEPHVNWSAPRPERENGIHLRPRLGIALAAAAVALVIAGFLLNNAYFGVPAGARGHVQSLDGVAYRISATGETPITAGDALREGELMRTAGGAHAFVQLSDGSIVEVRDRSEFRVNARGKDMTIVLDQGAVLVQAAKRTSGHLYVKTSDCRVAVTGTIFSVNSGTKGSRVAVVEGTVLVAHAGTDTVLHAGDQVATSDNMSPVPVQQEISWSSNREKYISLLAQFATLQQRLEQVPLPAPRYSSDLLDRMPTSTVLYLSIPNLGETLSQANAIFQDQLQKSSTLRQWWSGGHHENQDEFNATIEKFRLMSQYLGDEVVILGMDGVKSTEIGVIAEVQRPGLADFLKSQFAESDPQHKLMVVDEAGLPSLSKGSSQEHGMALVRDHEVVFSNSVDLLNRINTQLNTGASGFSDSDFGRQIQAAYGRGAGFIVAANLHQMMRDNYRHNKARYAGNKGMNFQASGLADAQYLIAEHREINGVPENHLNLQFSGERRGVASWLAAPAPMGSLEYVSRNAGLVLAFVAKEPQSIVDDIMRMATRQDSSPQRWLEGGNQLQINLRDDVATHLGGEAVMALDGPVLPTPSWKLIVEVHDPAELQASLLRMMQAISEQAQKNGKGGVAIQSTSVAGQPFYTVRDLTSGSDTADYTFAGGYMILGSSRAVVMEALRTQSNGNSLARSASFKALLPKDENENYSAIGYQNLSPILQPLLSQLTGEEASMIQKLAADAHPTVLCAWGKDNRIEAAGNSRLFGLDLLTFGTLLKSGNLSGVRTVEGANGHY